MRLNSISNMVKFVAENSQHVKINTKNLRGVLLNNSKSTHWLIDSPFNLLDLGIDQLVNLLLIYHSIGFCYWGNPKWSLNTEYGKLDGSFALIYLFKKEADANKGFLDFSRFKDWSFTQFANFLQANDGNLKLIKERYKNFVQTSKIVCDKFDNDFYNLIKNIDTDTELFDFIIKNFPAYDDRRTYKGKEVGFYKRAQLLVSDILHIKEYKQHKICDYSHLVGCADYKIPQILREFGILEYDQELANLVDSKSLILENSNEEIEIRANTLMAICKIKECYSNLTNIEINDMIWGLSQQRKSKLPYHLTITTSY